MGAEGALLHHSDRGAQYLSIRYSERLAEVGIEPSVGRVEFATLEWGDWFNHRRLLEGIGYVPRAELEEAYDPQCEESAMVA